MKAESYLLLAIWCLVGFAFYWRTMKVDKDRQRDESITIAALFFLLIVSIVIWYFKKMMEGTVSHSNAVLYSFVLLSFILFGLIVMLMVHSQLKKRQMLLETERIRAVENSQAKSRFLFNMSHDIRTPMNAVIGYTDLALKENISPVVRDYLEKSDLSSHHMLSLINDILEMSRIESGKVELEEVPTDIRAVFTEIEHLFTEQMKQKNIRFEIRCEIPPESYVYCDKKNLTRVVMNLISNAYKFTPENGSVAVAVRETLSSTEEKSYDRV